MKTNMLLILMTLTLAKTASADRDCSQIASYNLNVNYYSDSYNVPLTDQEKNIKVRFFQEALSQEENMNTKCVKLTELKNTDRYQIVSYNCGKISYMVNHYDENNHLLKQDFAVVPYEYISRRARVDEKIYEAGAVLGEAMDLVGPAVAIVAGPVVGIGDTVADFAQNAEERTKDNRKAAKNNILRFLESDKSLKLCQ